jgi:hypothetical protein
MSAMPPFHGSDTSNNQGSGVVAIGPEIAALGGTGWWHKATQSNGYRDRYWPACRQARIDVGLHYGGPYHWLSPSTPVSEQFRFFRDYVGGLTVGEAIQLDMEEGGLSDSQVIEAVELWEGEWPGRVLHYMGYYFGGGMPARMAARFGDMWRWWLPWYQNSYPSQVEQSGLVPVVWQWAGGATGVVIPSLRARVDSNEIRDERRLEEASGYGGQPPPPPPGGNMAMNGLIIDLRDSWVVFEGAWNGARVIGPIRWIDGATRADRLAAGHDRIDRSWRELGSMVYLGSVLPHGDGHPQGPGDAWDGSQFADFITRAGAAPIDLNALAAAVRNDIKSRL